MDNAPVTGWLNAARQNDENAVRKLFDLFYASLVKAADRKLGRRRVPMDGSDIANSAFNTFIRRLQQGEFCDVDNRVSIEKMLMTIAIRKAANRVRSENAKRRGGDRLRYSVERDNDVYVKNVSTCDLDETLEEFAEAIPSGIRENAIQVLRLRLEAYTHSECAARMEISQRSVERLQAQLQDCAQRYFLKIGLQTGDVC